MPHKHPSIYFLKLGGNGSFVYPVWVHIYSHYKVQLFLKSDGNRQIDIKKERERHIICKNQNRTW